MRPVLLTCCLVLGSYTSMAQELPIVRRLSNLAPAYLDSAQERPLPAYVEGARGRVLVLFRVSMRGSVIEVRASGGSETAKQLASEAVKKWRFRPTLLNGFPVQMLSGAVFDFASAPVRAQSAAPMSAEQISPVLNTRCQIAVTQKNPDGVPLCTKEAAAVGNNPSRTPLELASALDELGVALMNAHNAPEALVEFNRAVEAANGALAAEPGETAVMFFHRATAEGQSRHIPEALADLEIAERSLKGALADGTPTAKPYQALLSAVLQQHAALLETVGRHEESLSVQRQYEGEK